MSKCKDPDVGNLLHAYELDALSEEDAERFEIHLLECEYCFDQLKNFEQEAALLRSDDEAKQLIRETVREEYLQSESLLTRFWQYVWPETPLVFKPALAYLLVLLMILPAYLGLKESRDNEIGSPQIISLAPDRSSTEGFFEINLQSDGLVRFVFRDAVVGEDYRVIIESEDGAVVYQNDDFDRFDEYGRGELVFPHSKMKPGNYRLVISDPEGEPPSNRQEYSFRIEK